MIIDVDAMGRTNGSLDLGNQSIPHNKMLDALYIGISNSFSILTKLRRIM